MTYFRNKHPDLVIPESKKVTGKICNIGELTLTNCDLDENIHKGFTIGKGKKLYWMMIWHKSGHVTVYRDNCGLHPNGRYIDGNTEITIHFI